MGCGCKQKRIDEAERARQQAMTIKLTENPRPPEPVHPPVQQDVDKIVEKLNDILTP
jgi:hypothetical protein